MQKKVKQFQVNIGDIKRLKKDVYLLSFSSAYLAKTSRPGTFLQVKVEKAILRRPLSIHKVEGNLIFILFRVRGKGTQALSEKKAGDRLDIIGPLGNGFKLEKNAFSILVAGGIGIAPLLFLAQRLGKSSKSKIQNPRLKNIVLIGAKNNKDLVCIKEFKDLGFKVKIATEDGSFGQKGFVTDLLKDLLSTVDCRLSTNLYACGPKEMFGEIKKLAKGEKHIKVQVSFEQFMGCGLGVCCACVIDTQAGYKKVCQDGPVFDAGEI